MNKKGHVAGLANEIRYLLQGGRFWQNQLSVLDQEVESLEAIPAQRTEIERTFQKLAQKLDRQNNDELEQLYSKIPELRPTLAERKA